jgi:hypothetical protein
MIPVRCRPRRGSAWTRIRKRGTDSEDHEETAVSWPRDAFETPRQIVLIEHRVNGLADTVGELAVTCQEFDRRLGRWEAKFALLEQMATPGRRSFAKSPKNDVHACL